MITNITIKNVKGYGDPAKSIDLEIKSNRVNLIFGPNGAGKSSLAAAFSSLTATKLDVDKDNKFHKDDALDSELSVTLDDITYTANSLKNEITPNLKCVVINCDTKVTTLQKTIPNRFTTASGYLDIEDIVIKEKIPEDITPVYLISKIRQNFGENSGFLKNYKTIFLQKSFSASIYKVKTAIETFNGKKKSLMLLNIQSTIQSLKNKTIAQIESSLPEKLFDDLKNDSSFRLIYLEFQDIFQPLSDLGAYDLFFQILSFYRDNKENLLQLKKRNDYNLFKERFDQNLSFLDSTWKKIRTVESNGQLLVKFPHADEVSNGQRDILTFVAQLLKFQSLIKEGKKYLLLIDEVFDYLDDANIITAQYFLSQFLSHTKDSMYLCILTHLSPYTFRNYIFSDKMINFVYLIKTLPIATPAIKAFISFREGLNHKDSNQLLLYQNLSNYLFHYNPTPVDYSKTIASFHKPANLPQSYGKTDKLHYVLIEHVNKYLSGESEYDPYAVSMALRIRVEKNLYMTLSNETLKREFLSINSTKSKIEYCEEKGVRFLEVFKVVNAIHNEADHLSFDEHQKKYLEKPMVYKLQNLAIKNILKNIFGWKGIPLGTDVID